MKKFSFILIFSLVLFWGVVFAQEQTGEIIGTVTDQEGVPLPGVTVEADSPALVGTATAITDEMGRFRLVQLPPGVYTLKFSLPGFTTVERKDIEVRLGRTLRVDVSLRQATIEETITVTGEAPLVDVKKSATTMNITKEMFTKLPKGRNFTSVVTLSAGANDETELDGLSIDGASSSENMFFVDGVDTTDLHTGDPGQGVVFEFIDEVQVKSSGYEAEYGGSMGGVINVVTRSGGNEYHGELILYYNGSATNGKPRKTLRINPLDNTKAEYITYPEDTWHRYEFGFGLGGYILKDKVWFFVSALPTYLRTARDAHFISDPSKDATFYCDEWWYRASAKLTAQVFPGLRVSASFHNDYYKWKGDLPPLSGAGNPEKDWAAYGYNYPTWVAAAKADYIVSDNLYFSATGGYYRTNTKQLVGPPGPRYYHLRTNAGIPGVPPELVVPRYWYNYGYYDGYQTLKNLRTKITATFDGTYFFDLAGEHVFKAGFQFVRIGHDVNDAYPYDYYRFYWGENYESPNLGTVPTTYGYIEVREPFGTVANIHSNRYAIFVQDSWTIAERFTLNYGVRLEKEDIPSYSDLPEYQEPPIKFGFTDKIAPRIGFAYDVFGDGNFKVFGSFGIYYDVMKLAMAEGSYGGFKWISHYYDIATLDWTTFQESTHPMTGGFNGGTYFESLNWRIPSFETTQPDMEPYSKVEYTLGFQKKLMEDVSFTARFLHNRILWAIEDIGIQMPEGETYFNGNPGSDWINQKYKEAQDAGLMPPGVKCPRAKRKYYSLDLGIDKRFSNNWMAGFHYTWSYLWGNFSGLASSDEHGRKDPNVERYFDMWFLHYTQNYPEESTGKLPTDRPHQFKLYGAYSFDFGLTVGINAFAMSGTPISREFELNNQQGYYPLGRFTDGRTPFLWRVDLYAEYNWKISDKYTLQFNVNVINLTDNAIAQSVFNLINQANVYMDDWDIWDGFNYEEEIAKREALGTVVRDPRFLKERWFQPAISARFGIKFIF